MEKVDSNINFREIMTSIGSELKTDIREIAKEVQLIKIHQIEHGAKLDYFGKNLESLASTTTSQDLQIKALEKKHDDKIDILERKIKTAEDFILFLKSFISIFGVGGALALLRAYVETNK